MVSYDISFRVKVEGVDKFVPVGYQSANITWNVGKIIRLSTGLAWKNEENNGLCRDVIPKIMDGLCELIRHPEKYKQYEAENGWGTVEGTKRFFETILQEWEWYVEEHGDDVADVTTFWVI